MGSGKRCKPLYTGSGAEAQPSNGFPAFKCSEQPSLFFLFFLFFSSHYSGDIHFASGIFIMPMSRESQWRF